MNVVKIGQIYNAVDAYGEGFTDQRSEVINVEKLAGRTIAALVVIEGVDKDAVLTLPPIGRGVSGRAPPPHRIFGVGRDWHGRKNSLEADLIVY